MLGLNVYLTFAGNCASAMEFYHNCLGGELRLQKIEESPDGARIVPGMQGLILHATLTANNFTIMATDCVSEFGLCKGNDVSLYMNCSSDGELKLMFYKLTVGGAITQHPAPTLWGSIFGTFTDKFGIHWLLNYNHDYKF